MTDDVVPPNQNFPVPNAPAILAAVREVIFGVQLRTWLVAIFTVIFAIGALAIIDYNSDAVSTASDSSTWYWDVVWITVYTLVFMAFTATFVWLVQRDIPSLRLATSISLPRSVARQMAVGIAQHLVIGVGVAIIFGAYWINLWPGGIAVVIIVVALWWLMLRLVGWQAHAAAGADGRSVFDDCVTCWRTTRGAAAFWAWNLLVVAVVGYFAIYGAIFLGFAPAASFASVITYPFDLGYDARNLVNGGAVVIFGGALFGMFIVVQAAFVVALGDLVARSNDRTLTASERAPERPRAAAKFGLFCLALMGLTLAVLLARLILDADDLGVDPAFALGSATVLGTVGLFSFLYGRGWRMHTTIRIAAVVGLVVWVVAAGITTSAAGVFFPAQSDAQQCRLEAYDQEDLYWCDSEYDQAMEELDWLLE